MAARNEPFLIKPLMILLNTGAVNTSIIKAALNNFIIADVYSQIHLQQFNPESDISFISLLTPPPPPPNIPSRDQRCVQDFADVNILLW